MVVSLAVVLLERRLDLEADCNGSCEIFDGER